jgi:CubicO group peptidase (beta-lactamase class C family)
MLLRHGQVAVEACWTPYKLEYPHMMFSLSKSFTSTAIGLAVTEGWLSVDELVVSFFPDKHPIADEHL